MKVEDVKRFASVSKRFLDFVETREQVRLSKESGNDKPWTDNEIIQTYRFCNVRRADDKVSQWLIKNWYESYFNHPNMLLAVAFARFVNLPSSLMKVTELMFLNDGPDWKDIKVQLRKIKARGETVFNGAYMVRGNTKVSEDKIGTVVDEYIGDLVTQEKVRRVVRDSIIVRSSMENTHARLSDVYGFGSFMAGQVVADLRWAVQGTWEDKNHWAPLGPGSARGMNRLMGRDLKATLTQKQFEAELWEVINLCRDELPERVTGRLEAHDYQNCLCEFDKYERVLWGEGKPKQRYPGER